ncbi:MAG: cellobiose phosphorylase [Lachnospiraceae bacterium]|nr:cellobiose phosphorylase [Lachnospiraceae bacterium]
MQVIFEKNEVFKVSNPQENSYLYFPIAGKNGIMSSLTPTLGGDAKLSKDAFLYEPVSAENLHNNRSTRNFWCVIKNENAPSVLWSATGASAEEEYKKSENVEMRAGFMWQELTRKGSYGLNSKITAFVGIDSPNAETIIFEIENASDKDITFTPVVAFPLYGRSADDIRDHRHVTSLLHRTFIEKKGISLTPTLTFDERGHKTNKMSYFCFATDEAGKAPVGVIPATEDFIGEGGSFTNPLSLKNGDKAEGYYAINDNLYKEIDGYETTATLLFEDCTLKPSEKKTFIVLAGIAKNDAAPGTVHKSDNCDGNCSSCDGDGCGMDGINYYRTYIDFLYGNFAYIDLEKTQEYWRNEVNVSFETGDKERDGFLRWVAFQPLLRRIYGCSFLPHHDYGRGGRGFRDLWQDCLAMLLMNPSEVGGMIESYFDGIRSDGTNATIIGSKPGEFIADRNGIKRVWCDHGYWPLVTTKLYIDQTGDLDILFKDAAFFKDDMCLRGEGLDKAYASEELTALNRQLDENNKVYKASIFEHLLIENLTAIKDVGANGFVKLRGADWNDALDMAKEKGESVAFTYAYVGNLRTLADISRQLEKVNNSGDGMLLSKEVAKLLNETYSLTEYCEAVKHTFSGEKIAVSFNNIAECLDKIADKVTKLLHETEWVEGEYARYNSYYDNDGLKSDHDTEMYLTGQVYAIVSGVASEEQVKKISESADSLLFDETCGGYRLNSYLGSRSFENNTLGRMLGFAFGTKENGAVFSHMAVMFGNALYQRGFSKEGYKALNALYEQVKDTDLSKLYPGIPEYFNLKGRGLYHYLTGAASWYLYTVLSEMFGVKGRYGDLVINPKLQPDQFDKNGIAKAKFEFAGRQLTLVVENTKEGFNIKVYDEAENEIESEHMKNGVMITRDRLA